MQVRLPHMCVSVSYNSVTTESGSSCDARSEEDVPNRSKRRSFLDAAAVALFALRYNASPAWGSAASPSPRREIAGPVAEPNVLKEGFPPVVPRC